MMISMHLTFLYFWVTRGFVSCAMELPIDSVAVALGESITLDCTYNCSSGFVRGCWSKAPDNSGCYGRFRNSGFCTVSLHLPNISNEDLKKNYTCYTVDTDDFELPQKIKQIVLLKLKAQTRPLNWTAIPKPQTKDATHNAKPKISAGGEFTGIKVLAAFTIVLAMVLAALAVYLCLNWNRQLCICKGKPVTSISSSPLPLHSLLSPQKDDEHDFEVPYADIMITVRGVSTPELTQIGCLSPSDQKEGRGDKLRPHLQTSRSADRLYVPQAREVSRKMSTNSEYAIITYA